MARPLNKRYFKSAAAGPGTGNEIKVQFHNGTGSVAGWIVKQTGSKRFKCTDGTNTKTCYLVDKASGDLLAGEMTITVKNDAGTAKRVKKLAGRKLTLADGTISFWSFSNSTTDGKVEMEEAGEDKIIDNSTTDEDDFEGDDPAAPTP